MTLTLNAESLTDGIRFDFGQVRADLIDARYEQQRKDTPAARARLQDCMTRMNAVLDMWNDSAPARGVVHARRTATLSAPEAMGSSNTS